MKHKVKLATVASALCLVAMATPANATIELAKASDFQGEIVLIDGAVGTTGSTIFGHTNRSHTSITYDGEGETLQIGGTGQSFLTGQGDGVLTEFSYRLTDGGTFNNTEFKISGATDTIDFLVLDDSGDPFEFNDITLDSSGFIAFRGVDGQEISNVYFKVDDGGTFTEFRQLRLDVGFIPEPATWAMMITGFGMVGGAIRRRRMRTTVAYA